MEYEGGWNMSCLEHIYLNWLLEDIAREHGLRICYVALDPIEKKK